MSAGKTFANTYWPGVILLVFTILLTMGTYQDYGISWDEKIQKRIGEVTYNYIFSDDNTIKTFEDSRYGVGFELILTVIEKKLNITDDRDIYLMRHFITHIFFLLCAFCGYVLIQRLFNNQWLSCIGFLAIVFHPRIYAHSFFNTKDIPFLGIFLVALLIAQIAFVKNKQGWYLLLGILSGYAISIRILGILLVLLFGMLFLIDLFIALRQNKPPVRILLNLLVFLIGASGMTYLAWPALWEAPVQNFISFYQSASHFPWDGMLLFNGKLLHSKSLPWYYLPGWFAITTPVLWLGAGVCGMAMAVIALIKRPLHNLSNTNDRNYVIYLLCCVIPVSAVILLHSVVYDDWRHVYFIYPSFIILGLYAIDKFAGKARTIAFTLCAIQLAATGYFMVASHPFQQVYFNSLVSHKEEYLRKNYHMEYWGCSYKQGLEYILKHDTSDTIRLLHDNVPAKNSLLMVPKQERNRIKLAYDTEKPTYFITVFREPKKDYDYKNVIYEIKALNSTIMRVYKLDKGDKLP